jgi:hypothetical protein
MSKNDRDLDQLFAAYRRACQPPMIAGDFMPGIWNRIDSRRSFSRTLRRWTATFVTAAATLCVVMAIYMAIPLHDVSPVHTITYVETFGQDEPPETLAYSELASFDWPGSRGGQ